MKYLQSRGVRWVRRWLPAVLALALALLVQNGLTQSAAAELDHPFANSNVVYVSSNGTWREAYIEQVRGHMAIGGNANWAYTVRYLDPAQGVETGVPPSRLRSVQQAQSQGLTSNVYNLSTQAGINQILAAHNRARQAVGVPNVVWSPRLAASAQHWADVLLRENRFEHSPRSLRADGQIGENLHTRRSSAAGGALSTPTRAVQGWLDERAHYNYASNSCARGQMCGHYTQMVWKDTTAIGCAVARNRNARREVWVCHYSPAGNIVGRRPY